MRMPAIAAKPCGGTDYQSLLTNVETFVGKPVTLVGREVSYSFESDPSGRRTVKRVYVCTDDRNQGVTEQPFVIEGEPTLTPAADKASKTRGDNTIRRASGSLKQLEDVTLNVAGRETRIKAPVLTEVTLDVAAMSAQSGPPEELKWDPLLKSKVAEAMKAVEVNPVGSLYALRDLEMRQDKPKPNGSQKAWLGQYRRSIEPIALETMQRQFDEAAKQLDVRMNRAGNLGEQLM
jgi:hypothetical protein